MKRLIMLIFIAISILSFSNEIYLKNGQVVSGEVISESKEIIIVQTKYGELTIKKENLLNPLQVVEMKNGDVVIGVITKQDGKFVYLTNDNGNLKINKNDIADIKYSSKDYNKAITQKEFFSGEEKLMDVFFSPTGNVLKEGDIYFSLMSYGFGITENFQITSSWIEYFNNNLNIRPKLKVFDKWKGNHRHQIAIGSTLHSNFTTRVGSTSFWSSNEHYEDSYVEDAGTGLVETNWMIDGFGAYTFEYLKNRGSLAFTIGGATNSLNQNSAFFTFWTDITPKLIFMGELKANYNYKEESIFDSINDRNIADFTDIGVLYSLTDNFRFGIHFQEPYFTLYYKFR